ncbi:DNA-binding MarR family transcriptional regulator [Silvimonas terrae]|uniref:DNA-binding MarR family transcriptional regulator n=1 Tax=Silvimonas terrae TaxID=300266 RepID=A0A840RLK5_9NEIS|nr:MarR family transcriptional regulator [Silvimonas terrae]MBB5193484.1 DNA-binding MarR family transcriptional regulator [Silvimonas terrae]
MSDLLKLDQQLCFPLYAASNLMTRLYRPLLEDLDLTYPQYLVMLALWETAPRSVGDLGKQLFLDTGTLTPLLKRLQTRGLISRQRDPGDERRVVVDLTAEGKALKEKAEAVPRGLLCALPLPLEDVVDIRDRLQHFLHLLASADPRNQG